METIFPEKGLINHGDWAPIRKVMRKALSGQDIAIAFIGGSITMGSVSSTPENCYAAIVHKWWADKFPNSKVKYINAGIGGTTSQFGAARVRDDVLLHKPDFVLCEFAVNDENTPFFGETYESLVRVILKDESSPALMLMNNIMYDSGKSAAFEHIKVAKHYDIPMVSMEPTIYSRIQSGNIKAEDITPDNLHPNDEGHKLVASVVIDLLSKIYDSINENDVYTLCTKTGKLPEPLSDDAYENSMCIRTNNMDSSGCEVVLDGFVPDRRPKENYDDFFSLGFIGTNIGDSITFGAECTGLAIQYTKTINKPAPIAQAVLDGDEEHPIILNANFEETWGDCLYIENVGIHLQKKRHEVRITITDSNKEDKSPFYLLSVIVSK